MPINFSPEQQRIIDHTNGHALIIAGPGSGKTTTLLEHISQSIERGANPDRIWIIAFNKDIVEKLRSSVQAKMGSNSPHCATIHSFILQQTLRHGTELLGDFTIAETLGEFGVTLLVWEPIARRLRERTDIDAHNWNARTIQGKPLERLREHWLSQRNFSDPLFRALLYEVERIKGIYKIIFLDELAHQFVEWISNNIAFRQAVAMDKLIIDEFQDLNPTEHAILRQFNEEGALIMAFGDDDQAINEFRGAHADHIQSFITNFTPTQYPLPRNRRCPPQILQFADDVMGGIERLPKLTGAAPHTGRVEIINVDRDTEEIIATADIVQKYLASREPIGDKPEILILSESPRIGRMLNELQNRQIVASGQQLTNPLENKFGLAFNALLSMAMNGINSFMAAAWFASTNNSFFTRVNERINAQTSGTMLTFLEAVRMIDDVPVADSPLTILEEIIRQLTTNEIPIAEMLQLIRNNLSGSNEAKEFLVSIFDELISQNVLSGEFMQDAGLLRKKIDESNKKFTMQRVHVSTYRKAKGLEADLVIVLGVDSIAFPAQDSRRRLLYVAATRAKKNLIVFFANRRTAGRRFASGRDVRFSGRPQVYRSPLISSSYINQTFNPAWLNAWQPLI